MNADKVAALAAAALPPGAETQVTVLSSGAAVLDIRTPTRHAVIQCTSDGREVGYTLDPLEDEGLMGHDHVAASLADALAGVAELLAHPY